MARKNNILKILWAVIFLALAAGLPELLREKDFSSADVFWRLFLLGAGACAWGYITFRVVIFNRKLVYFIRRILENEYQAGIKIDILFNDEISGLEKLVNKMAERLRVYDELQVDRISALSRAIDNIYRNVQEGIIIYKIEKKIFQINPAVQAVFEVEQENFSYDSLDKQEANKDFISRLKDVIEKGMIIRGAKLILELPIRQIQREVSLTFIPIKDKNEIIELAIIFVNHLRKIEVS